jgi:hypothetical protein
MRTLRDRTLHQDDLADHQDKEALREVIDQINDQAITGVSLEATWTAPGLKVLPNPLGVRINGCRTDILKPTGAACPQIELINATRRMLTFYSSAVCKATFWIY